MKPLLLLGLLGWGTAGAAPAKTPHFGHVFVIVLENHGFGSVIGNKNMPEINRLAGTYGLATNFWAITHPSLPNYVALVSGSTHGIQDDDATVVLKGDNLADQLEHAGLSWKSYLGGLPEAGSKVNFAGVFGRYARKHNPFLLFKSIQQDMARAKQVVPLDQLASDLKSGEMPNFSLIVPDQCEDMHGTPACRGGKNLEATGDQVAGELVRKIMTSKSWGKNDVIFLTFDEADESAPAQGPEKVDQGGRVVLVVVSGKARGPISSKVAFNHYSVLRTVEEGFGLPVMGEARNSRALWGFFP
ncbi:alkaline phosphatase family protein [Deinococcus roseus]|uniref:Acid phosphatase n=1 Tax=Deinococcus roseus TaxID=392414 RepID=A0ABQ2DH65_9DEIO|nr:alkaline phosphatase family protein [Deinococcus roseus]GGJ57562.1 acid phosphatase [Deinococcus roseus]